MVIKLAMSDSFSGASGLEERDTLLILFNFFQISVFFSLLLVMLTAWCSPKVHRTLSWYLFIASWMVFCVSYFLIAGQQVGPEPPFAVCVTQAALIYASPPLTACASLAFLVQLYNTVTGILREHKAPSTPKILYFAPLVIYLLVFVEALTLGISKPGEVSRNDSGSFCHLTNSVQAKISAIVVIIAMITMLNYEVLIALVFYRNWGTFRRLPIRSRNAISLTLAVRVSIFSFMPMLGLGTGLAGQVSSAALRFLEPNPMLSPPPFQQPAH
ncbi:hypothetical protein C8F01DRAFT_1198154 [Mycena amicta]|nr:hypothetical protein C8F01DRAFT_1198154 [Mycena amicta]